MKNTVYKPHDLVTHYRFDVIIKYLYAKAIINGYNTGYFKEMYKEHLRVWNGFKEYNNPEKNTFEAFDKTFKDLIKDIGENGFNAEISKLPVEAHIHILNGAHRLAASLAHNAEVECVGGRNGVDGQKDCGYKMFKRLGLNSKYMDSTAIEYAKMIPNTHMVFLFPSAKGELDKVLQVLNTHGGVFYYKGIELNETGAFNLMRELYLGEPWAGNFQSNFNGYRHKQRLCYPNYGTTYGFLVEFDTLEKSLEAKEAIREIFNIGKHSVHINDTHKETIRLSKLVFNDNSIHHLNNMKLANYKTFDDCLNFFSSHLEDSEIDSDDYCVTASSTLSAYGLREGNDLDYLHSNPTLVKDTNDLIHSHNSYGVGRYHLDRDEIIYNPDNHFYHRGVKFASLDVVKKLKENRGEPKDKIDVDLINSVL